MLVEEFNALNQISWFASAYYFPQAALTVFLGKLTTIINLRWAWVISVATFTSMWRNLPVLRNSSADINSSWLSGMRCSAFCKHFHYWPSGLRDRGCSPIANWPGNALYHHERGRKTCLHCAGGRSRSTCLRHRSTNRGNLCRKTELPLWFCGQSSHDNRIRDDGLFRFQSAAPQQTTCPLLVDLEEGVRPAWVCSLSHINPDSSFGTAICSAVK